VYSLPSEEYKERRIFASISIGMCKQRRVQTDDEQYKSNVEFDLYMAMTMHFLFFFKIVSNMRFSFFFGSDQMSDIVCRDLLTSTRQSMVHFSITLASNKFA
jgi:5-keto 4-deoxyuronate isomerase